MPFSNRTEHYGLPQYAPDDKPTYLGDMNSAYATIDTQIYNANAKANSASETATSAGQTASQANEQATENKTSIQDLRSILQGTETKINTLLNNIKIDRYDYRIITTNEKVTIAGGQPETPFKLLKFTIGSFEIYYLDCACTFTLSEKMPLNDFLKSIYVDGLERNIPLDQGTANMISPVGIAGGKITYPDSSSMLSTFDISLSYNNPVSGKYSFKTVYEDTRTTVQTTGLIRINEFCYFY